MVLNGHVCCVYVFDVCEGDSKWVCVKVCSRGQWYGVSVYDCICIWVCHMSLCLYELMHCVCFSGSCVWVSIFMWVCGGGLEQER